ATVMGIARAAAHAPVRSLRSQLRAVAQDGTHPGHRAASAALAEVGDDLVLAGEVSRLLSRPLTVHSAARLAGLPLERLRVDAGRIAAVPRGAEDGAAAWLWTAVAAARLGDVTRLDDWLRGVDGDGRASWPQVPVWLPELRAVLPLPESLMAHLDLCLTDAPIHRVLRSAWLAPPQVAPTPERLDDLSGPLAAFVAGVTTSAAFAGAGLAHGALRLPSGVAPDPSAVYEA
ncbi:MAG TPA: hypothetical protein VFQ15_01825, partial [Jiangellaceae bacterium]|nr:hypothetical protein [Jiangellaceae bacterium]